tara:strand:+ start:1453 stop:1899 length:447 start_codon:yes stop_codon:yes gene_type:complete
MLNIENILTEWKEDSVINGSKLDKSSMDTAKLHAKYLQLLSVAKLQYKKSQMDQKTLLKDKWLYYNGKMSQEEIEVRGWDYDPFDGLKVMKGDMDYYYDSDKDIQKSEEKITYYKTLVETLQEIVETLRWRHQTIGNIIKWKQFENGG